MAQTPQDSDQVTSTQALCCQSSTHVALETEVEARKLSQVAIPSPTTLKTLASALPTSPTMRNPANRLWAKATQREAFMQHLRRWASDHDSSAHFHGGIGLHPQDTVPGEGIELGKSVKCLLFNTSFTYPPTNIVVRLYQSERYRDSTPKVQERDPVMPPVHARRAPSRQSMKDKHGAELPIQHQKFSQHYQLVVRSGSGWVTARQYLDKHHFNTRAKSVTEAASQSLAPHDGAVALLSEFVAHQSGPVSQIVPQQATAISHYLVAALRTNANNFQANSTQIPGWISVSSDTVTANHGNVIRSNAFPVGQRRESVLCQHSSRTPGSPVFGKDVVSINPLFRPFSRLPQELQDEILYHAVGYTGNVNIIRTVPVKNAVLSPEPAITMSKLFRISKSINEHMVAHIFRSTNFQFGMTGFTNFLWQIGPVNRSHLQNLTFRFGKASLLHCVRWLAPDSVWELLEPPIATNPPTLTYFWRCQLQDLMKEVTLLNLTIDIRDAPLADVPMLIRILRSAIGSTQHIHIVDDIGSEAELGKCKQSLHRRFPDFQDDTWRELVLRYHADYKHRRWHMRHILTQHGEDARSLLNEWMDQDRSFFDA